jgi:hypothetical protein
MVLEEAAMEKPVLLVMVALMQAMEPVAVLKGVTETRTPAAVAVEAVTLEEAVQVVLAL